TVVDHDYFVAIWLAGENCLRLFHEQREVLGFVLRGNEDADIGVTRQRLKRLATLEALRRISLWHGRHTRFRILAERTPSWSRYLATVRRAIWTPLSRRILTIA